MITVKMWCEGRRGNSKNTIKMNILSPKSGDYFRFIWEDVPKQEGDLIVKKFISGGRCKWSTCSECTGFWLIGEVDLDFFTTISSIEHTIGQERLTNE